MKGLEVELLRADGTDLDCANAARVSFKKYSQILSLKDESLIKFCAMHGHFTCFTHNFIKFHIKAPLAVRAQLTKHTIGLGMSHEVQSNEMSARYVEMEPEFLMPEFRLAAANAKQGSSNEVLEGDAFWELQEVFQASYDAAHNAYQMALDHGVAKEVSRFVLPTSTETEWIWSGSLWAMARVCKLRQDPHTQKETRVIADQIAMHCEKAWPVSWSAVNMDANKAKLDRIKAKVLSEIGPLGDSGDVSEAYFNEVINNIKTIFEQS